MILPIPPGCHGVSVAVQNYLSTFTDHDLVCLRLDDTKNLEYWDDYNAAVAAFVPFFFFVSCFCVFVFWIFEFFLYFRIFFGFFFLIAHFLF